ncbi:short chain dehydrogenase domain protein [Oleiphilus messinensis]|uniref:Short chain dehydrogenase domain protein n=1 Tax=Oleiphilus messinensis TaxID=141451 RepID=A0A1Y0I4Y2_9GAMM|nr:alpha/beta fold hydrolase [Oleiphilus messinensis]ARU54595.1 short chain dehydrogenase domain protein [Oleiphilus messinensis]
MKPSQFVESGTVRLAVYTWGKRPTSRSPRPTVVLVHGYPDSAEGWAQVAEYLAKDAYVVAYDVRGAGQSSAPKGSKPYALEHLVGDLTAVIDTVSPMQPVHLVGHDWGGLQGWEAVQSKALKYRIASYNALAPALDHVGLWFQSRMRSGSPRQVVEAAHQLLGSSYMAAFQLPLLPELTWRYGLAHQWPRFLNLLEGIKTKPRPSQAADGRFGLGLYRANLIPKLMKPEPRRVDIPVQLLIMERDRFVPERLFTGVENWAPNTLRTHIDAGHWAPLSHPEPLAQAIGDFIQNHH